MYHSITWSGLFHLQTGHYSNNEKFGKQANNGNGKMLENEDSFVGK